MKKNKSTFDRKKFAIKLRSRPLIFGYENSKLKKTHTFSLPSGWTCPGAKDCLSRANKENGKIQDGPCCRFRCFSASQEAVYTSVRMIRWHNFDLLRKAKTVKEMVLLILQGLPYDAELVRLHVAGDFFNQMYFDAWMEVARQRPAVTFYTYTKSLRLWSNRVKNIPYNVKLNASAGGKFDKAINQYDFKSATVVFTEKDAKDLKLTIDTDDSHAWKQDKSFALLIHGSQPAGSLAGKCWQKIKMKKMKGKK